MRAHAMDAAGETANMLFWSKVRTARLVGHPTTLRRDWQRKAIPLIIHGDGAQFTKKSHNGRRIENDSI